MPYTAQIASTKQKLAETKQAIKALQGKKATITDAAELKSINKQINALQEEIGKLKSDIRLYASLNRDAIRRLSRDGSGGFGLIGELNIVWILCSRTSRLSLLDSRLERQKYRRGVGMRIARQRSAPS